LKARFYKDFSEAFQIPGSGKAWTSYRNFLTISSAWIENFKKGGFLHKKQGLSLVKNPALGNNSMSDWTTALKPP